MAMELAAWFASALVFTTFFMKTMILLRVVAIMSNVAFIGYALLGLRYGIFEKVFPILVLHSLLLPLNLLRVHEMKRLENCGSSVSGTGRPRIGRRARRHWHAVGTEASRHVVISCGRWV